MVFVILFNRVFGYKTFGYSPAQIPGFTTLGIGIFLLCGLIMILLGVIGEYIGRIYLEIKKRPIYIIDEVYEQKESVKNGYSNSSEKVTVIK